MKKDIDFLPFPWRVRCTLPVIERGVAGTVEIDVMRSNYRYGSRFIDFHIVSSRRNLNYKKYYFRFRGDTYYF